jgi:uncharacterized protein YndB with AHSA1/START domain
MTDATDNTSLEPITIEAVINAPMAKVWEYWNAPEHIVQWAFASEDWEAPASSNDLRVGGKFTTTMAAKDKSASFEFEGTYTAVKEHKLIEYDMTDGRHVKAVFTQLPDGVKVVQSFDPENENPREMQRDGWQAILNNFKKHVEQ